ncbi:methyltransferase SirN-like, putative [Trichophyton benhamiae CBS 112371]|uniref:Methyltransferase SirN-like, putative n=2 Tax=Trichophyton TaxID=5550 RepID=D4AX12_ARTBC|nr:methyltransferase SirN-like, putative [Trichophyton benhamiae CBS 112371]XP_003025659.1 methyltransferase SirN-like, putative [Trichophyton verrucosum HKI 0517]EFE32543.1 methyltransferase SirN-like, putative [Trichophyton benhamiae CBS 112371]EFE45048.1 methyltransferase SirN-like, putative [Trichophyton verrucosum HKI 0517]
MAIIISVRSSQDQATKPVYLGDSHQTKGGDSTMLPASTLLRMNMLESGEDRALAAASHFLPCALLANSFQTSHQLSGVAIRLANMGDHQDRQFEQDKSRYVIPGGSVERDRLRVQHEWIKGTAGGLIKAPLDLTAQGMKVLDSATADGFWIHDVRLVLPDDTEYVGFDIAVTEPFPPAWENSFDLINQRLLFAFFQRQEINQIVKRLVGCLKPGGWIQFFEYDHYTMVTDPQATTYLLFYKFAEQKVRNLHVKRDIMDALADAGCEHIQSECLEMVAGSAHVDREQGMRGRRVSRVLFHSFGSLVKLEDIGLSEDRRPSLAAELEKDMDMYKTGVAGNFIWAQKPEGI